MNTRFNRLMLRARQTHLKMGKLLDQASAIDPDNVEQMRKKGAEYQAARAELEDTLSQVRNLVTECWQKKSANKLKRAGDTIVPFKLRDNAPSNAARARAFH